MRWNVLVIAIGTALVAAVTLWWTRGPSITNYPTAGTNIIIFGDSLAWGQGSTDGGDIASRLSRQFDLSVLNLGVSGDTTADGLARIEQVLEQDPHVVIVLLGGNDALRKVPVETTFANLTQIIEQLQAAGAAVLLVGEPGGLYGSRYPKMYEGLAKQYGVAYVPNILHGLIGRAEYMSDAIHPNDAGYAVAADRIAPLLQALLDGAVDN
jgi:acyl-CoA thioesterase-1